MFEHFVDTEYPQNFQKPDNLACLPYYFHIFQTLQQQGDIEWYQAYKVNNIQRLDEEPDLVTGDNETGEILNREEDNRGDVNHIDHF